MKTIPLTQGKVALVDDADYANVNRYRWYAHRNGCCYYAERMTPISRSKRRSVRMHRMVLGVPDGIEIDHKNGNGLDNRGLNLRLCTHGENTKNQKLSCNNTTTFKGVYRKRNRKKPYCAQIQLNGRRTHIGYYETPELAAQAYDLAVVKHYGRFALTNEMLGLL